MNSSTPPRQVVTFWLDGQTYAAPVETVVKIVEMVTITPLLNLDGSLVGVINVHGQIAPVIDLRCHLRRPELAWQRHAPILLARIGGRMTGLIVDEVLDILRLTADQITSPADVLPHELPDVPLLRGVIRQAQDRLVLLLDLEYLLQPDQVQALAQGIAHWLQTQFHATSELTLPAGEVES